MVLGLSATDGLEESALRNGPTHCWASSFRVGFLDKNRNTEYLDFAKLNSRQMFRIHRLQDMPLWEITFLSLCCGLMVNSCWGPVDAAPRGYSECSVKRAQCFCELLLAVCGGGGCNAGVLVKTSHASRRGIHTPLHCVFQSPSSRDNLCPLSGGRGPGRWLCC